MSVITLGKVTGKYRYHTFACLFIAGIKKHIDVNRGSVSFLAIPYGENSVGLVRTPGRCMFSKCALFLFLIFNLVLLDSLVILSMPG